MSKLKWWFRIVGGFYLLLALANLYGVFINPQMYSSRFGFTDKIATQAFVDGWAAFVMDMLVIGAFALWASRDPLKHVSAAWFIIWMEVFHGIADDLYLIARGYDLVGYIVFIVIHIIIIVTGAMFAREAAAKVAA